MKIVESVPQANDVLPRQPSDSRAERASSRSHKRLKPATSDSESKTDGDDSAGEGESQRKNRELLYQDGEDPVGDSPYAHECNNSVGLIEGQKYRLQTGENDSGRHANNAYVRGSFPRTYGGVPRSQAPVAFLRPKRRKGLKGSPEG